MTMFLGISFFSARHQRETRIPGINSRGLWIVLSPRGLKRIHNSLGILNLLSPLLRHVDAERQNVEGLDMSIYRQIPRELWTPAETETSP